MPRLSVLKESMTTWAMPIATVSDLQNAQIILSHEFGDQKTMGPTNTAIARKAASLQETYSLPWIAQYPQNKSVYSTANFVISRNLTRPGTYLDAHEVNRQAVDLCRIFGWVRVVLIAHDDFAWRAAKDLEQQGSGDIQVFVPDLSDIPYPSDIQRWDVRNRSVFRARERLVRVVGWSLGWF